ncbi:MAG: NAD(+) synthase [Clostridiales bacterium]|jgi:NAD+ synthase (glutamine-hydrolysing)|nr:NAD(+) synthase [Clostridiales bacterium]
MKLGFVKAAACVPTVEVGAPDRNRAAILKLLTSADRKKTELAAFPLDALTGASLGSMRGYSLITDGAIAALTDLAADTKELRCAAVVGLPLCIDGETVSAAAVVGKGVIAGFAADLPPERLKNRSVKIDGRDVPLCAVFNAGNRDFTFAVAFGEDFDLIESRAAALVKSGADLVINMSAGKALIDSFESRRVKIAAQSKRLACAYLYVSAGGGESVAKNVFCGDLFAAENGELLGAVEGDKSDSLYVEFDFDLVKNAKKFAGLPRPAADVSGSVTVNIESRDGDITRHTERLPFVPPSAQFDRISDIMGRGIRTRMNDAKCDKVIFGLSGGLDSTTVLLTSVKMFEKYGLDKKNIVAVTMRGPGSSDRTANNSRALIEALGVSHIDVPIIKAVEDHLEAIGHSKKDTVYENAQARERAQILLDLANKHNALMLGTGDLSETALGWSTYGGDQLAQYNPNSSLTKTLIRAMARNYCLTTSNAAAAKIINDVLNTPVSPELLAGQETEALLGPFELHDFFLYNLIGRGFSVEKVWELAAIAFRDITKKKILKYMRLFVQRFFANQFKRNAGCDGIQVTEFDLSDKVIYTEFSDRLYIQQIDALDAGK